MTKKRSIRRFVLLAIVVAIGIVLAVGGFRIPFTHYRYNGFANSISLGLDLSGGLAVVYDCETTGNGDLNNSIDATITRLQSVLYSEGYSEALVTKQGSSRIRIEVPGANENDDIFTFLENPQTLSMTLEKSDATTSPRVWVEGSDIRDVNAGYNNQDSQWMVLLDFNDAGRTKFADLTREAANTTKTIYVYLGDVYGEP